MSVGRYHIIIDLKEVADDPLSSKEGLEQFLVDLSKKIGMNVLAGPYVVEGIPQNPGLTGLLAIDFSHISAHTFTNSKEALIDIFSCKPYDQKIAQNFTLEYFQVDRSKARIKEVYWS